MPKLTIVVTTFNIEAFVGECLADIVSQTLRDLEIIVVDDGSTDSTPERIREFATRDSRIVPILLPENSVGGVATAANTGIEHASGDFIGFADGDDRYDPTMFEKLVAAAERYEADLALCGYCDWDATTDETAVPADDTRWQEIAAAGVLDLDAAGRRQLLALNSVPWRKIYSAHLLKEHGIRFPVGDFFFEDNPFHWFNVLTADRCAFVGERLCRHRVNRLGQTTSSVSSQLFKIFQHHAIIKDWMEENHRDADFGLDLFVWVTRQVRWIARKCPDALRRDLFDAIAEAMAPYSTEFITSAPVRDIIGKRLSRVLRDARVGDYDRFCADLDRYSGKSRSALDEVKALAKGLLRS